MARKAPEETSEHSWFVSRRFPTKYSRFRAIVVDGILIGWALATTLITGAIIVPLVISIALNAIGGAPCSEAATHRATKLDQKNEQYQRPRKGE